MNVTLIFIAVSFLVGLACGNAAGKLIAEGEKLSADEYRILVQRINNDSNIAADAKMRLLNQLQDYSCRIGMRLESLDGRLQGMIKGVKSVF